MTVPLTGSSIRSVYVNNSLQRFPTRRRHTAQNPFQRVSILIGKGHGLAKHKGAKEKTSGSRSHPWHTSLYPLSQKCIRPTEGEPDWFDHQHHKTWLHSPLHSQFYWSQQAVWLGNKQKVCWRGRKKTRCECLCLDASTLFLSPAEECPPFFPSGYLKAIDMTNPTFLTAVNLQTLHLSFDGKSESFTTSHPLSKISAVRPAGDSLFN